MLRAIIFDMDGVLLDSESRHYQVLRQLLGEYGYCYTREHFLQYCGIPEYDMWPKLLQAAKIDADPEILQQEHQGRYRADREKHGLPRFPGLGQFLCRLKQHGYDLAVASGSAPKTISENINLLGYASYFDQIVSAQNCPHAKPEPDVFLFAARQLGVQPKECLVIEDSRNGMLAAKRAGMPYVGFYGAEVRPDMSLAQFKFCDYRTTTPEQLVQWYHGQ